MLSMSDMLEESMHLLVCIFFKYIFESRVICIYSIDYIQDHTKEFVRITVNERKLIKSAF